MMHMDGMLVIKYRHLRHLEAFMMQNRNLFPYVFPLGERFSNFSNSIYQRRLFQTPSTHNFVTLNGGKIADGMTLEWYQLDELLLLDIKVHGATEVRGQFGKYNNIR